MRALAQARTAATTAAADVCLTVASLHARAGRLDSAAALLDYAIAAAPDDRRALRLSAHVLVENGDGAAALARLARLEALGDRGRGHDVLTARALLAAGRLPEARERFRRRLDLRPLDRNPTEPSS